MTRAQLACVLVCAAACAAPRPPAVRRAGDNLDPIDERYTREQLADDLRATVLEAYEMLSGGYDDQYLDGLDQNPRLVLIDVEAGDVIVGYHPSASQLRRQFPDKKMELVSKALEVHLSRDGTVGWSYDDLSYRVTHEGRRATIPLRATAVYERVGGRWMKTLEHVSYAVPDAQAFGWAGERKLPAPAKLGDDKSAGDDARAVRELVEKLIAGEGDVGKLVVNDERALILGSDPDREARGAAAAEFASVRALYGFDWRVNATALHVRVARTRGVAWAVANLELVSPDGHVVLPLRATWVLEQGTDGVWRAVQTHVSVPVPKELLAMLVFGEEISAARPRRSPAARAAGSGSRDRRGRCRSAAASCRRRGAAGTAT